MGEAINAQGIWKSYRLGSGVYRYQTLRDAVAHGVAKLLRRPTEIEPRRRFWALRDVSFRVNEGETLGIIGRNGAGKTTLFKVVSRITYPTRGHATIHGRVGSLLEVGTGFHPELTGRENIVLNGAIMGMSRAEVLRKQDQIVEFAGLTAFTDTPVKRYSTGMSMRLAFSVAAHLEPEIMLVDEVLAVGDIEFQRRALNRIAEIASEGRTVLFVSHNMNAIERICSRAILLKDGQIEADGPTRDVVNTYHSTSAPVQVDEEKILSGDIQSPTLLSWSLDSSESAGTYSMVSGARCEFVFRVALPDPVSDAFFGMAIYNSENVAAAAMSSFDLQGRCVDLDAGIHEVVFELPSFPAGRGHHRLRLSLNERNGGRIARWEAYPEFEVLRRRESVQVPPPWEGVMSLHGDFRVRPARSEVGSPASNPHSLEDSRNRRRDVDPP